MKQQARRKHKMTGEGQSEWPTLTLPPDLGPSVEAYFLVHVRSLHLSTIPLVLVSNFPFVEVDFDEIENLFGVSFALVLFLPNEVISYVYKCKDRNICSHRRSQDFPNGGHTVSK